MAVDCCNLVGNFPTSGLPDGCMISIGINTKTEISKVEDQFIVGPTIGTVSLTAYAGFNVHHGCPVKASVSIDWLRKLDCDITDYRGDPGQVHFIYRGGGSSSMYGVGDSTFDIGFEYKVRDFRIIEANSSSGPASLYTDDIRSEGFGLNYNEDPIPFDTARKLSEDNSVRFDEDSGLFLGLLNYHPFYLQNFSFDATPGQLPKASYTFLFAITGEEFNI